MPALSPTMSQGNVSSWQVKEGDEITAGDVLAEIETDKATLEWENQDDGFIAKILVKAGTKDIAVGTPLAIVVDDENKIAEFGDYTPESPQASADPSKDQEEKQPSKPDAHEEAEQPPREAPQRIGPAALHLLRESGLTQEQVTPTGPRGTLTKGDVLAALKGKKSPAAGAEAQARHEKSEKAKAPPPEPKPAEQPKAAADKEEKPHEEAPPEASSQEAHKDIPNSQIRKIIAQRLLESKQAVPHYYIQATADLEAVTQLRQTMKAQGTKVSVNDFVVRAVALALAEVPRANAIWDSEAQDAVPADSVDVAIAVATDKGLITPIIRAANTKSLKQVSEEVRELAGRARANKLKPDEFQGGTFTVSNLGMYGIDNFCAIINPPQAGILAVGGSQQSVSLVDGRPVARACMTLTLSADQRVFDGQTTASFLQAVSTILESPVRLLVQ